MPRRTVALALTLLACAALPAAAQAPAPGELVLNEVMYDPPAGAAANEWIEVLNVSSRPLELAGLTVSDNASASAPAPATTVAPGGYVVFVRDAAAFAATWPGVPFVALAGFPTLNNTGDRVAIAVGGVALDEIVYTTAWGGDNASLERRDPAGPSVQANFGTTTAPAGGTPGAQNSLFAVDTTPPALSTAAAVDASTLDLTFSEPLDAATVQPADVTVDGGIGAATAVTVSGAVVRATFGAPFQPGTGYTVTVTDVADAAGNVLASGSAEFVFGSLPAPQPGDVVINEILYDPPAPQPSTSEWIELYNRSDAAVDLGGLVVTDATGQSGPLAGPRVLGPGAYLVIVARPADFAAAYPGVSFATVTGFPSLNNTGDRVGISVGGVEIDAVPYTSAWGGTDASLERRDPRGPSTSATNWATTTDPSGGTPGRQNSRFAPDTAGPLLTAGAASPDGRTISLTVDEPVDPASVTAGAFTVSSGAAVTAATYDGAQMITLSLAAPLPDGGATVTASGLTDLLGNVRPTTSVAVAFTPDATPPAIARASATSAMTVRVTFTEPVTVASAGAPSVYSIDGGIGAPVSVALETGPSGGAVAAVLTLPAPLAERQIYTLTATGLADLAGNVAASASARLFFGTADTPERGDLAINELMFDPTAGSAGEYVELLNTTADRVFDLRGLTLDGDALATEPVVVLPGEYVVLARDVAVFATVFPGVGAVEVPGLSLSNSGDTVVLARTDGAVVDSVAYDPDWHREELDDATGISLERRDPRGPSSAASNWSSSLDPRGGTPGILNTATVAANPQPRDGGVTVTSPFAPDEGQAAEIAYTLEAPAALVRVRIFDGGGRRVREVEDGTLSGATGRVLWDGRADDGARLRAGIYVVLLEAVDVEGGTTEAHRAAIVLARR